MNIETLEDLYIEMMNEPHYWRSDGFACEDRSERWEFMRFVFARQIAGGERPKNAREALCVLIMGIGFLKDGLPEALANHDLLDAMSDAIREVSKSGGHQFTEIDLVRMRV